MKHLLLAAMALCTSSAAAQSAPKLAPCDSSSVLLTAAPIFNVGTKTLAAACPAFAQALVRFGQGSDSLTAAIVARIVHGAPAVPPVVVPPKDSTPVIIPPKDSTPVVTPPAPPPAVSSWTKLGAAGNLWSFVGLRVVRWTLGDSSKALYGTFYGQVECGLSGFANKAPSGGSGVGYCEAGPVLLDTLAVPQKMGPIQASTIIAPKGSPGVGVEQVRSSGGAGIKTDGTGSFRTTCMLSKFIFDDPIVFPGVTGVSHLHMLFGNTAVTGLTNSLTLASTGNSTCLGGIDNRTAYWTPAVIDANGNAVMPDRSEFYYKQGQFIKPATLIQTLPAGLKMVAGSKDATGKQTSPDGLLQDVTWTCYNGTAKSAGDITIPNCAVGDKLLLTVIFPQCWDGKNLDSPDHKSHVAYPLYASNGSTLQPHCPADHPVAIPEITEHFYWPVVAGAAPSTWHLSSDMDLTKPGGLSAHADWMNGWDPATMLAIVQNCLQKAVDCEIGGLGGKILY